MKISVIGCGRWGTFIAWYLSDLHDVKLWGRVGSCHMKTLMETRKNEYLTLKDNIKLTTDLDEAMESDVIIISVLAQEFKNVMQELKKKNVKDKIVVLCMKGIESETGKRLSEIAIENDVDKQKLAVWVGPGHVQNFIQGIPNCMIIVSSNMDLTKKLVSAFSTKLIRFYIGNDIIGAEIGAATKNILGIAAGMLDGMNMACLKGALMARGTREVARLIKVLGGNVLTPYGLSHLGDFEATLFSKLSQNRMWGEKFVTHEESQKSAEGVGNILGILVLANKYKVEMPITEMLYQVIFKGLDLKIAFEKMFLRGIKEEFGSQDE